ncbi:PepSY-associated TM helix domain-containing protein [Sphingomonas hengshuiensis]|uniref:Peptidase n=1 Tax=Sphingomonas hengshuiensis TaxID=1609977 RepID=A0A7U5BEX3_9SPHN|nr:PepSY-associated TM helix domain-containing protein [Sphingomonas hengshuiensis]AJP74007.1 peptidase [Sphingomonas hengshuiensis]
MTAIPEGATVKRSLSAHAAVGLLAGALLYIVSLTGTIAVFFEEWQRIEQRGAPEMTAIEPQALQRGIAAVLASEAGKPRTTHLFAHLPVESLPRTTITTDTQAVHLDAQGATAAREEVAWSDFLVELHYLLNIPGIVGLALVGMLGVMMLMLALSGVIAHPRIFRDAFRLRARNPNGIGLADWHNRLSVWTLPFTVAIALTGAVIGLGSLTGYAVAQLDYGGDVEAVYAPIFGGEGKPDPRAAPVPNVEAALTYMRAHHPGLRLSYVTLHDPLTVGQHIQVIGTPERRLVFGEYYNFDAQGRFVGTAGLSDGALGQQASASTYNLHFGNFGGLPVKIGYFVLGAALTAICATGSYIWLGKRRRRGIDEPRLRAVWDAVVWGSPAILAATFVLRKLLGNGVPLVAIYWLGSVALIIAGVVVWTPGRLARALQAALAVLVVAGAGLTLAG